MLFRAKMRPAPEKDWVTQAVDTIERVIDGIRDKTVVPITLIARGVVYGLLAAILGVGALVLLSILLVRLLDTYLDNIPGFPSGVWVADLFTGAIFVLVGALAWSQRTAKSPNTKG